MQCSWLVIRTSLFICIQKLSFSVLQNTLYSTDLLQATKLKIGNGKSKINNEKRLFLQWQDCIHLNDSSLAKQPCVWMWGSPLAWAGWCCWEPGCRAAECCGVALAQGRVPMNTLYKWVLSSGTKAYELLQLLLCSWYVLCGISLTKFQSMWWESICQGKVPFSHYGPSLVFLLVFFHSATSYIQPHQGLARSWDLFLNPLLAKEERTCCDICLPLWDLLWGLLPNCFIT